MYIQPLGHIIFQLENGFIQVKITVQRYNTYNTCTLLGFIHL